ncbi:MAG: hypothetical protein AAF316_15495 [Cyanobacteria bacterium P01_A01_bin.80]
MTPYSRSKNIGVFRTFGDRDRTLFLAEGRWQMAEARRGKEEVMCSAV